MPLNVGEVVEDRYRVVRQLGQGGMGAVYQAWDTRLNRPIALKEMRPQAGLDAATLAQLRQQFQQEAQILATLTHPNLVRVTDYFSWSGNEYLVMDFVEGESLAQRIRHEGAMPETQVLHCAEQLLDALGYCHGQGVLHRDLKPQNIIITPEGRAILVDFGLVKLWDPRDPRTRTAMRGMGTPEYAPPEQYDVGAGHTDPRSDIYGLGATLYHMLTGQLPPTATQRMASPSSFLTPRRVNSAISPAVEAIVLKALEIQMDRRFRTTDEMAQALGFARRSPHAVPRTAVVAEQPPLAQAGRPAKPKPGPPAEAEPKRRKGIFLGLGGVGLAVVGLGCLGLAVAAIVIGVRLLGDGTPAVPVTPSATVDREVTPTDTVPPTEVVPTPEATESQIGLEALVLEENFSDPNSGWEIGAYDFGSVDYVDGAYSVVSLGDGSTMWGVANVWIDDVVIEVDATQISAPQNNNNAYGVVCRDQGSDQKTGYYFFIAGDGAYAIAKAQEGAFEWLVEWASSDVIRQGNATNRIQVMCDGPALTLVANGRELASAYDTTFSEGDIALTAASLESEPTEIYFDNLVVSTP
jgi:predicted Ser/Thr protein kinase